MFKLDLEKAEEPEIKSPISTGSSKKQEISRKTSISALLTMPKPLTVFCSVQSLSRVWLFMTPWTAALQASLSITNFRSSLRLTSIQSVMPSSHRILCCPLLLLPPIPPSIRVFSNESTLRMRWPKYWSFSFSIISSKEIPANLENSAVATGLEKGSFHSNPKERQCQRMLKLPHNCTHLTCS